MTSLHLQLQISSRTCVDDVAWRDVDIARDVAQAWRCCCHGSILLWDFVRHARLTRNTTHSSGRVLSHCSSSLTTSTHLRSLCKMMSFNINMIICFHEFLFLKYSSKSLSRFTIFQCFSLLCSPLVASVWSKITSCRLPCIVEKLLSNYCRAKS